MRKDGGAQRRSRRGAWREALGRLGVAWASCVAVLIVLTSHPAPVLAEPTAAEIAVARRLFREATALSKQKEWRKAAEKLREALSIKETPGLRYHLARAEEKMGNLVEAQVEYDRAAELIEGGAKAPDVERLLDGKRQALRERIPTVRLEVSKEVESPALSIDDAPVAPALLREAIPLNPGAHRVELTAAGMKPFQIELELGEGEDRVIQADLTPLESSAAAGREPESTFREKTPGEDRVRGSGIDTRTIVLIAGGAVAIAGAAIGIVGLAERSSAGDRIERNQQVIDERALEQGVPSDNACVETDGYQPPESECAGLVKALEDHRQAKTLAIVGFAAAGAGAVTLGATLALWPTGDDGVGTKREKPRSWVGVRPVSGGVVTMIGGAF